METASIELWHGSSHVIKHPEYGLVKPNNDYGRGFYCTRSVELAKEWACAGLDDGFANRYTLTTDGLLFLDLSQPPYTILNWLAMLVENRRFQPTTAVAAQGIEYLKQVFLPDASQADVIVGYRADDSYFSFARAFVNNAISIDQLAEAMRLGELGKQIVDQGHVDRPGGLTGLEVQHAGCCGEIAARQRAAVARGVAQAHGAGGRSVQGHEEAGRALGLVEQQVADGHRRRSGRCVVVDHRHAGAGTRAPARHGQAGRAQAQHQHIAVLQQRQKRHRLTRLRMSQRALLGSI